MWLHRSALLLPHITLLLWGLLSSDVTHAAPQSRIQKVGPCIGMDCLHGVLMHGDTEQGDDHKGEDTYERLDREDRLKESHQKSGPCVGDDCLQDTEDMAQANQKIGPELKQQPGPQQAMDQLDEVMMQGDEQSGQTDEDAETQNEDSQEEPEGPCLDCTEGRLHSTHLDLDASEEETEGEEDPDSSEEDNQPTGLYDPDRTNHSPRQQEEDMDNPKPLVFDPDKLLHPDGDSYDGNMQQEASDERPGTYNADTLLHAGNKDAHHQEKAADTVELSKIKEKHEHDDFKRWMAKKMRDGEAEEADQLGYSQPFISDTVMDDIDQMKQRYVLHDWEEEEDTGEEGNEEVESLGDDGSEEEEDEEWEWEEDIEEIIADEEEILADDLEEQLYELREVLMEDDDSLPCIDCDDGKDHAHGEQLAFKKINVHDRQSREQAEQMEEMRMSEPLRSGVGLEDEEET